MSMKLSNTRWKLFMLLAFFVVALNFGAHDALAGPGTPDPNCTDDTLFDKDYGQEIYDAMRNIVQMMHDNVIVTMNNLYAGIVTSNVYTTSVYASMVLVLIFYATSFMFGLQQATLAEVMIRLVKFGFLFWLLKPGVTTGLYSLGAGGGSIWSACSGLFGAGIGALGSDGGTLINCYLGRFFFDGSTQIIMAVLEVAKGNYPLTTIGGYTISGGLQSLIGGGGVSVIDGADITSPLVVFKDLLAIVFNPRTFVIMAATLTTGPYGLLMGIALIWSFWSFIMMMIKALQVYVLSIVVRAILISLAPIFFAFLLFERTKNLFMGWMNQLANFSLQPILVFAFLSFFTILITSAVADMIPKNDVEVCFVKVADIKGTPGTVKTWRFKIDGQIAEVKWGPDGAKLYNQNGDELAATALPFPIGILEILIVIILVYLANQMIGVVTQIAAELSSSVMRLDEIPNAFSQMFGGKSGGGGGKDGYARQLQANAANRKTTG